MHSVGVALVIISCCGMVACGDGDQADDPAVETTEPPRSTVLVQLDPAAPPEEFDAAFGVLEERIDLLGLPAKISRDGLDVSILVASMDEALVRRAVEAPVTVEFRPVLEQLDPSDTELTPVDEIDPGAVAVLLSDDGGAVRVGPARLDGTAIEGATAQPGDAGGWTVGLVLLAGADGIDSFNELAADCYESTDSCPAAAPGQRGEIAVVVDGMVVVAAAVNEQEFGRDQISIGVAGGEIEARSLAVGIGAGPSPAGWSVRD